jgi:hypothetical protein
MLTASRREKVRGDVATTQKIVENLLSGSTSGPDKVAESPVLTAMLDAFTAAAQRHQPMAVCAGAAIDVAGETHIAMLRAGHANPEGGVGAEPPVTDLLPMLEATSTRTALAASDPGMPANPVNADAMRMLMAIETYASDIPHVARRNSLAALAERDRARESFRNVSRPTDMSAAELRATIECLAERLAA